MTIIAGSHARVNVIKAPRPVAARSFEAWLDEVDADSYRPPAPDPGYGPAHPEWRSSGPGLDARGRNDGYTGPCEAATFDEMGRPDRRQGSPEYRG